MTDEANRRVSQAAKARKTLTLQMQGDRMWKLVMGEAI